MRNYVLAAATAATSLVTIGVVSMTTPAATAWANDIPLVSQASLLPQIVVEEAKLEGQTPAHPLPDLTQTSKFVSDKAATDRPALEKTAVRGGSLSDLVRAYSSTQTPNRESECLAVTVYFEAKSEPLIGQLAVAETVINRSRSGRFPSSLCGVLMQRGQFSFVRGGSYPAVARGGQQWKNAVAIARIAQEDLHDSSVGSALFFHARSVSPGWKLRRIGSVGNHVFYR
jgi:N-acetylmuramoyl-L-alanine amidase